MAVLGPGRVSIGFPEAVRSILTEPCPKRSHGDPIQPQNYFFSKVFPCLASRFHVFWLNFGSPEALPRRTDPQPPPPWCSGPLPAPSARWGGGLRPPPKPPHPPEVYEGLRPSNSPKKKNPRASPQYDNMIYLYSMVIREYDHILK